jgi:hypothetical protein
MADDDDDPQLRSMRAAWRSLPDEDPPERGLAELMAAARQQASVMSGARTPWWKMLLRPPVLALATVLVLIGGVFAVTATHKGVSPEPTGVDQTTAPVASPPPPPSREAPVVPATGGLAQPQSPTPAPAESSPAIAKPPAPPPAHHTATHALAPPKVVDHLEAPVASPPPPPPAAAARDDDESDAPAPATRGAISKSAASDAAASTPRRQLDGQLLAQCRDAASRGDCETAKKIAARIQADDAAYYTQSVATDTAIAKCLSE